MPKKRNWKKASKEANTPLWKGPEEDGISQSLLSEFLVCRERFRVKTIEGLAPIEGWSHTWGYGNLWHCCEEAYAAGEDWEKALREYALEEMDLWKVDSPKIQRFYEMCRRQFPAYLAYWEGSDDEKGREPIWQEKEFKYPLELPSGRVVNVLGKMDAVDFSGKKVKGKRPIILQENKAKGEINEESLGRQLGFDLQTGVYMCVLETMIEDGVEDLQGGFLKAVRYNVVRRPLSGGKGSIKPLSATKNKPAESMSDYYDRAASYFWAGTEKGCPETFFMRWTVNMLKGDLHRFRKQFLEPILQQLCDWYDWVTDGGECVADPWREGNTLHWQHPYGVYDPFQRGGETGVDNYLRSGSRSGLTKLTTLFPELEIGDDA